MINGDVVAAWHASACRRPGSPGDVGATTGRVRSGSHTKRMTLGRGLAELPEEDGFDLFEPVAPAPVVEGVASGGDLVVHLCFAIELDVIAVYRGVGVDAAGAADASAAPAVVFLDAAAPAPSAGAAPSRSAFRARRIRRRHRRCHHRHLPMY